MHISALSRLTRCVHVDTFALSMARPQQTNGQMRSKLLPADYRPAMPSFSHRIFASWGNRSLGPFATAARATFKREAKTGHKSKRRNHSDSSNVSAGLCFATDSNSTRNGIQDPLPGTNTGRRVEAKVGDVVRIAWPKGSTFRIRPANPNSVQSGSRNGPVNHP
jgi:hypothetical protein